MADYFNIDAILASQEDVPVHLKTSLSHCGYLSSGFAASNSDEMGADDLVVAEGDNVTVYLPIFLAAALENHVSIQ
ncbi:hypothetical protein KIPB_013891, partial [Kipferlia bialata]|eukprot:g13891.t1